jgi:hypothetical protein
MDHVTACLEEFVVEEDEAEAEEESVDNFDGVMGSVDL